MLGNLTGWHLLILLAIVILIFGAAKLPLLAKSVGQSVKIFKGEMKTVHEDDAKPVIIEEAAAPKPTLHDTVAKS
jgi:sec-independent protein translocase protein TatA